MAGAEKRRTKWEEITLTWRRSVFFYDLLWALILALLALYLVAAYRCDSAAAASRCGLLPCLRTCCGLLTDYKVFINCAWAGALGGVTISLKGVYDHGNPNNPWSNAYNLWHFGRPVSGAIAGVIVALLFMLLFPTEKFSHLVLYGVAFIFGTQDAAFFSFLSTFAARFLPKNDASAPTPLQVTAISPANGKATTEVRITGHSFDQKAVVKIGSLKLDALTIAPDGTAATGKVPKLGLAKDTKVDVAVVNPGGRSVVLLDGFTYDGDA